MRLYGKRLARKYVDKRVEAKTETRDAVVWSIDEYNYLARCKIQGSNEYVYAHYPRNWKNKPYWLKPGNAVSIRHRQGVRGYIEVTGEGRAIPTAIEGDSFPVFAKLPDMILSGLTMNELDPVVWGAYVPGGWFRIGGVEYYVTAETTDFITMDDPAPMTMGSDLLIGQGGYSVALENNLAFTSGEHRYDIFVIGADGVIDYISGETSRYPTQPSYPDNHLPLSDYILVSNLDVGFEEHMIGNTWAYAYPAFLVASARSGSGTIDESGRFEWMPSGESAYPNPTCVITVEVFDQYNISMPPGVGGYNFSAELLQQNNSSGDIYSSDSGWTSGFPKIVYQHTTSKNCQFTYRRDQIPIEDERTPALQFILMTTVPRYGFVYIQLLGEDGNPITEGFGP